MSSQDWDSASYKPDLTDKLLPSVKVRTNRLTVTDVTVSAALSMVPVFVRSLRIKSERTNTGVVYIGASVSSDLRNNGYPLASGEELPLDVNDLSVVFYQGDHQGDAIRLIYGS